MAKIAGAWDASFDRCGDRIKPHSHHAIPFVRWRSRWDFGKWDIAQQTEFHDFGS